MSLPSNYLQMLSTLTADGELHLELVEKPMPEPRPDQIIVRVEAAPINPSDQGVMFGWANMAAAKTSGSGRDTVLTAPVPDQAMRIMKGRVGDPLTLGNEGAGTVVAAGDSEYAQSLVGKTVAAMGGAMYGQYRVVNIMMAMPLGPDHTAKDGASCFVNPLTALSFIETMKLEDHSAIVHTAAASNLGQMLVKICQDDGVDLVNIVRKPEQAALLKDLGAKYVLNSSEKTFLPDLTDAIHETGATLGFDATGGGELASTILTAMEGAAARTPGAYSIYGSVKHKQIYLYGGLNPSPTTLSRAYGMAWGVGGWLMPNFLARVGLETTTKMRERVLAELKTTFASHYTDEISLYDALKVDVMQRYYAKSTGEKFLICPQMEG